MHLVTWLDSHWIAATGNAHILTSIVTGTGQKETSQFSFYSDPNYPNYPSHFHPSEEEYIDVESVEKWIRTKLTMKLNPG